MKKNRKGQKSPATAAFIMVAIAIGAGVAGALLFRQGPGPASRPVSTYAARPKGTITFSREIAPIIYSECSPCHRPGETAPFNLLSYADVQKRAQQIIKVTHDRYMPPFLPEPGVFPFANARRLTDEQLGLLNQWFEEGLAEGSTADLPARPAWTEGWQLGPPDLVVKMPAAYPLAAEGRDVYRNFVVPTQITERRFVRAVEFRPGTRAIHHAFIQVDRTRNSRRKDELDPDVGFSGMDSPVSVESPSGHFLGWQPGRGPTQLPAGLPWTIEAGTDLVLQIHLQPTGKPESVQPTIGLYFTTQGPTNTPFKLALSSYAIDIPAGATNHPVEDQFVLPIDVRLLAVLPHAHYLGRRLEGRATLPDGSELPLITIQNWDFNWQSDFQYERAIPLPAGTRLSMRFTYDNSAANPRNPHHPPRRVQYGLQSSDEMAELWFQLLTHSAADLERLQEVYGRRVAGDSIQFSQFLLKQDPNNARAYNNLGKALVALGRANEAGEYFAMAARLRPDFDEALYHLGVMASIAGNDLEAERQFLAAIASNPDHYKARNNLGLIYMAQRRMEEARQQFLQVLRINPGDPNATANLERVERVRSGAAP